MKTGGAELHDATALTEAFKGCPGIFVMTPPLFDSADPKRDQAGFGIKENLFR